jgi:hypothetical protein
MSLTHTLAIVGIVLVVAGTISMAYTAFKPPEWMFLSERARRT